jgi:hypothetical protein
VFNGIRGKQEVLEKNLLPAFLLWDADHIENDASNNSFVVACIFVNVVKTVWPI